LWLEKIYIDVDFILCSTLKLSLLSSHAICLLIGLDRASVVPNDSTAAQIASRDSSCRFPQFRHNQHNVNVVVVVVAMCGNLQHKQRNGK